jgi:hypothetical protein
MRCRIGVAKDKGVILAAALAAARHNLTIVVVARATVGDDQPSSAALTVIQRSNRMICVRGRLGLDGDQKKSNTTATGPGTASGPGAKGRLHYSNWILEMVEFGRSLSMSP